MSELICPECGYKNPAGTQFCDDCGALLESLDKSDETTEEIVAVRCGDVIEERYEISRILSNSDATSTYLAKDRKNGNNVVWIKQKCEKDDVEADFKKQQELFRVLSENEFESVVKPIDFFRVENRFYYVYEKLDGEDLKSLIKAKGNEIDEQHILHIAIQAAEGLSFIHSLEILHKDIKPSHVFLTDKGIIKFVGFGRADFVASPVQDNSVTEGFSPPEFFGLMGGKASVRSDIFSLGATLYYLATGSEPKHFSREHSFNFLPMEDTDRKIGKRLEEIIFKALKKDPGDRYESADAFLQDLLDIERYGEEEEARKAPKLKFDIFTKSHVGLVRSVNQDSCLVAVNSSLEKSRPTEYTLLIVADGMGGVAEGDKASSLAIRVITREVLEGYMPIITGADTVRLFSDEDIQEKASYVVRRAIERANKTVFEYSQMDVSRRGMGSTLTVILIEKDNMCICHAGDTRAYLYNKEEGLVKLTEDHSLVGRLVRMGQLTWEEARNSPQRSAVYRALGTSPDLEVDVGQRFIKEGDLLLICSDGVWEYYPETELKEIIEKEQTPAKIGEKLVATCLERGADDNATLIVLQANAANGTSGGDSRQEENKG
ncbi:MAG: protein kinase [Firmicutes bacterium]|nr:protein kinase [Bacillota bacterium]